MRSFSITGLAAAVALLSAFGWSCADNEEAAAPQPRATMHRVFEALVELLPLSLDAERFADPARRDDIERQLDVIAGSTAQLQAHAQGRDAGFGQLSRSLSHDLAETRRRYAEGRHEEARFYLVAATQNCVACHSRLPKARDFPLAGRLTGTLEVSSLSPRERAHFFVVTRSFDRALDTWEAFFLDPEVTPVQMDTGWTFFDYLTVCIQVQGDLERPRRTIEQVSARPDMPAYLRERFASWSRALAVLRTHEPSAPSVERARALVQASGAGARYDDQERVIYDLAAASVLNQFIDGAGEGDPGLPEAFYLLGVIEDRTAQSYWVAMTEFHLETAIRLDPKGPFAVAAYELLKDYLTVGYGGTQGVHLPEDVRAHLSELRALIDASG